MTRIAVDTILSDKLHALTQPVELCDATGIVLGCFVPAADPRRFVPVTAGLTERELETRRQSAEWYTTEQVLNHLEHI